MVESDKYVCVLSRHIQLRPSKKKEIISELEGHLEDKASELVKQGVRWETARSLALKQMGDPVALARLLQEVHSVVGLREMALAVVPHILLAGLVAFKLCDSFTAVALTLALVCGVTWLNWRNGHPGIWSYPWLGFTLAAPAIFLLMALIGPGKSVHGMLAADPFPVSLFLVLFFIGYLATVFWVLARIVYKFVQHDWLLVAFSALPIAVTTGWVLIAQWLDPTWGAHTGFMGWYEAPWVFVFLAIAGITAAFLKLGRPHVRMGHLLLSTAILVSITYATLLLNYHLVPVRLTLAALVALIWAPALRKPLASSARVLQNMFQTTLHLIGK